MPVWLLLFRKIVLIPYDTKRKSMTHYKLQLVPSLQPSFMDLVLHSVDAEKKNVTFIQATKQKYIIFNKSEHEQQQKMSPVWTPEAYPLSTND